MGEKAGKNHTGHLWVEEGEVREGLVAEVAPVAPIDKLYTFAVPDELAPTLAPGQRVRVPMGRKGRLADGFCVEVHPGRWTSTLKFIDGLIDPRSYLNAELLALGQWIARYYGCPRGRALNALVPQAVRSRSGFQTVRYARLAAAPTDKSKARRGEKQIAVLRALSESNAPIEVNRLMADTSASLATLRSMAKHGWVEITETKEPTAAPDFDRTQAEPPFALNAEQRAALARIEAIVDGGGFHVALLYGVSGSGKTEVYIRAMRRVLAAGRQAILLVPEIALTTQLVNRLASRFTDVAVIHSGLSDVARSLTWEAIATGAKRVVIGTRSAIFAPCPDLGLIVVDEEQESSYKNLQSPRFHVRDVAIKRAQLASVPVVLGSATPSLESWVNCERKKHYERVHLPERVRSLPLPRVYLVDMREEYEVLGRFAVLSRLMEEKLSATLDRGEQAVLLINRRGYASSLFCPHCKMRLECPNCHVGLVFHSATGTALCHYCRYRLTVPDVCPNPSCGAGLVTYGLGTQRVEAVLQKYFPGARVQRADSDTMLTASKYRELIDDLESRRTDVVVGTQMIAKGLDFPFVSFVGVLDADIARTAPDFRAGERLFHLITQVAGRAGRGDSPGEVVVQSMAVETPALQAAMSHDFVRFAAAELPLRKKFRYPPYSRLTRFILSGAKEGVVRGEAAALAERVRGAIPETGVPTADVLGPQPCPLARLRGLYRYDMLLRAPDAPGMQRVMDHLRGNKLLNPKVKSFVIDVDPIALA